MEMLATLIDPFLDEIVVTAITVGVTFIVKACIYFVKKTETQMDDRLFAMAVLYAQDVIKGSGRGGAKLTAALNWIEKVTKGKVKGEFAMGGVRSAFKKLEPELKQLKNQ